MPDTNRSSTGSMFRRIAALAVPTFGQLIAEPAFILIDTAIVGHVGTSALAGLSLGSTIILTAVGLCIFLAYATTSQVARLFGAGKRKEGLQSGMDSLWLSLVIGIVLAVVLYVGAEPLCALLGGRGDDLAQAVIYVRAVVLGVPGMLLVYAANGIFRGLQKVRITLVVAVAGAVLNTVLDVVFIIGLGWGVGGSGFATFIAQWFMGIALVVPAVRWALYGGADWQPRWRNVVAVGGDGLPLFFRTLALRVGLVATVMAAASLGTEVLAGYQVVNATWNFALNVLDSVAIAGQALVGAELGAARTVNARKLTRITLRSGLIVGIFVGAAFALIGLVAPQAFSPNASVQHLTTVGMVVTGIALPLQGWMFGADGILIGAGDFRYLAATCAAVTLIYIGVLAALVFGIMPTISDASDASDASVRCGLLWCAFNFVLMGGRAITNGLRIRSDVWMRNAN